MIVLISPAKTLDFETPPITKKFTQPDFLSQSQQLMEILKKLSPAEISTLMGTSDKISALNSVRFHQWQPPFTLTNAKQSILAFKGDVYTGLDAENFSRQQLDFAQRHLRILSGLYGVLRPLDLIQPYRLEMGTKLQNRAGKDLYAFWNTQVTEWINQESGDAPVINLASQEYFKVVHPSSLKSPVISPVFKEMKNGQYKIISFYAKKARGMMARYIIENNIIHPDSLTRFDYEDYAYNPSLSSPASPVFTRG